MISTTSYKSRLSHKTGLWACRRRHSIASRTLATARPRRPTASPSRTPTPSTMQRGPLHRRRPQARLLAVVQRLAHSGRWHLYHIRIAPVMYSISMRAAGQAAERGRVMPREHGQHTRNRVCNTLSARGRRRDAPAGPRRGGARLPGRAGRGAVRGGRRVGAARPYPNPSVAGSDRRARSSPRLATSPGRTCGRACLCAARDPARPCCLCPPALHAPNTAHAAVDPSPGSSPLL